MILVYTQMNDGVERVTSVSIIPKDMAPKGNLPSGTHMFTDADIPTDFYRNYNTYYVLDGMLHLDPNIATM